MPRPRISIVIPSYNQAQFLEATLLSVIRQDYPDKEIIVIDGGSTDGSFKILERYASHLHYWVSERDQGQSHALNKGFSRTSGNLLTWLNSDDIFLAGALRAVAERYTARPSLRYQWLAGGCIWMSPYGDALRCSRGTSWSEVLARLGLVSVSGPSSFFSPSLLEDAGPVNESLHYMMDTELWLRFARVGARFDQISRYLWGFRLHPNAKMSGHNFSDSPMADKEHAVWARRQSERNYIESTYRVTKAELLASQVYSRVLRFGTLTTPRALLDTALYRGRRLQNWCLAG